MTASKIDGFLLPLHATYHQASFERAGNHRGQVPGFNIAPDLASSSALFYNGSETIKPRTQGLPTFGPQPGIAIVGIDGGVQQPGRSTESGIPSVPPKRVSIASFQAWSKASPASSCLLEK